MKSFCPFSSALVSRCPLATAMASSSSFSAHSAMVGFAGDDAAGVEVDDVLHACGQRRVGGDLDHRRHRIAGGRAQPGGEQHQVRARSHLRGHALHVVARRALQGESRRGGVLGIVDDVADGRDAALARRACRLDGVGGQPVR